MRRILILLFLPLCVYSQDTIVTKRNVIIPCKVLAITATHINYRDLLGESRMIEIQKVKEKKINSEPIILNKGVRALNEGNNILTVLGEAYRNVKDYKEKKPFVLSEFTFEYLAQHPNFYSVKCVDQHAAYQIDGMNTWGIVDNDTLFLNALRLGMRDGYIKVRELGRYSYFLGDPIKTRDQYDRVTNMTIMFGLIGGLVTEALIYEQNRDNIHYVVNLDGSGNPHLLNHYYMEYILQDYPELLAQFKAEANIKGIETQLKYIRLLNKL